MRADTVLVTDGDAIASVPVLRSLKRQGLRVIAAAAEDRNALASYSRECDAFVSHPSLSTGARALSALRDIARRQGVDVVLPLSDGAVRFAMTHRSALEQVTRLAIPPDACLEIAEDKRKTIDRARDLRGAIEPPRTYEVYQPEDLDSLEVDRFPVLVKPRDGAGAVGIRLASDFTELRAAYHQVSQLFPQPLVQEYVDYEPGEKYQLLYLFDHRGRLRSRYMQRVLVEAATVRSMGDGARVRGGNGLLWESCSDVGLLERGQELMEALSWQGFGFIECVRDRTSGDFRLMEINTRMAGTIALSLRSGPPFAHGACLVAQGVQPDPVLEYRSGERAAHTWKLLIHLLRARDLGGRRTELVAALLQDSVFDLRDWIPSAIQVARHVKGGFHQIGLTQG